jgi:hypothetical protein
MNQYDTKFIMTYKPYFECDQILKWYDKRYKNIEDEETTELEFDMRHFAPYPEQVVDAIALDRSIKSYMQMKGAVL